MCDFVISSRLLQPGELSYSLYISILLKGDSHTPQRACSTVRHQLPGSKCVNVSDAVSCPWYYNRYLAVAVLRCDTARTHLRS